MQNTSTEHPIFEAIRNLDFQTVQEIVKNAPIKIVLMNEKNAAGQMPPQYADALYKEAIREQWLHPSEEADRRYNILSKMAPRLQGEAQDAFPEWLGGAYPN